MPAAQRFGFMRKYSTDEYSMEMGRAVDIWSESAVYVVAVLELNRLMAKIKVWILCETGNDITFLIYLEYTEASYICF